MDNPTFLYTYHFFFNVCVRSKEHGNIKRALDNWKWTIEIYFWEEKQTFEIHAPLKHSIGTDSSQVIAALANTHCSIFIQVMRLLHIWYLKISRYPDCCGLQCNTPFQFFYTLFMTPICINVQEWVNCNFRKMVGLSVLSICTFNTNNADWGEKNV